MNSKVSKRLWLQNVRNRARLQWTRLEHNRRPGLLEEIQNSLFVVSWNVAGIAEKDINSFFDPVNDAHPWGILFLQETFRRTEGPRSA